MRFCFLNSDRSVVSFGYFLISVKIFSSYCIERMGEVTVHMLKKHKWESLYPRSGTYRIRLQFSVETLLAWLVRNSVACAVVPSILQIASKKQYERKASRIALICRFCFLWKYLLYHLLKTLFLLKKAKALPKWWIQKSTVFVPYRSAKITWRF